MENNLFSINQEKEKVSGLARNKEQEANNLKGQIQNLKDQVDKMAEFQVACEQLHVRV